MEFTLVGNGTGIPDQMQIVNKCHRTSFRGSMNIQQICRVCQMKLIADATMCLGRAL